MATRVGVVLSGCGASDGSEINEAVLALYWIERAGGRAIIMAPDVTQGRVVDHRTKALDAQAAPRAVLAEAARIARGRIRDIATVKESDLDALVFPGGNGVATVLSNYAEKGVICEVHPEVTRLLKAMLQRRRPMGFICLAPILAARVLGPSAGVRITFGSKACEEAKHAAVMGADVRPCPEREILVDEKNRVVSTPAYMMLALPSSGWSGRSCRSPVTVARGRMRMRTRTSNAPSANRLRSLPRAHPGMAACWFVVRQTVKPRSRLLLIQSAVLLNLVERLLVFDFPGGGSFFEILDAAANLGVDLVVDVHVLLEDVRHPLSQGGVVGEDLFDVRRLHERLDHLGRHPIQTFVAQPEPFLVRDLAFDFAKVLVGQVALLKKILRLLGAFPIQAEVLFEHGLHIQFGLALVEDGQIIAIDQGLDDLGRNNRNLASV
jgi:enhancing lycopene biosynthesis protein 2